MGMTKAMKALEERLQRIRAEMDRLKIQEDLILDMMREERGEPETKKRAPRANVKRTVLSMLADAGSNGINAAIAVERAHQDMGIDLDRGSVSSLLSRLKNDGTVVYDGTVYKLKEHSTADGVAHPLRSPGGVMR